MVNWLTWLEEKLSKEWYPMIRDNPFPFIVAFLLGGILAGLFYRQQMIVDDQTIADYKERLGIAPKETKYEQLTHQELKKETFELVNRLQDFRQSSINEQRERERTLEQQIQEASSEDERSQLYQRKINDSQKLRLAADDKFQRFFLAEVQAVRNAMLTRMPTDQYQKFQNSMVVPFVETGQLAGPDPVGMIANDLDAMAKMLPSQSGRWFLYWQDTLFTVLIFLLIVLAILRQVAKYTREHT